MPPTAEAHSSCSDAGLFMVAHILLLRRLLSVSFHKARQPTADKALVCGKKKKIKKNPFLPCQKSAHHSLWFFCLLGTHTHTHTHSERGFQLSASPSFLSLSSHGPLTVSLSLALSLLRLLLQKGGGLSNSCLDSHACLWQGGLYSSATEE